jgi:hypothetical protein
MFFHSVEFYVIAVIVAAAIIGVVARPASRGEARTWLLPGSLSVSDTVPEAPAISITVDDNHNLRLRRIGLSDVESVNFAVTLIGCDIAIEEHIIPASHASTSGHIVADVSMDFIGAERYHLSYSAPGLSLFASTRFTVRPGIEIYKEFTLS